MSASCDVTVPDRTRRVTRISGLPPLFLNFVHALPHATQYLARTLLSYTSMSRYTSSNPTPVDPNELFNVICGAASQDPALMKASSTRLKDMLEMFGTYDALHQIASQTTVPLPVRQQSIIQVKNNALSHWRSRKYVRTIPALRLVFTTIRLLNDDHRANIRARSLLLINEADDLVRPCRIRSIYGKTLMLRFGQIADTNKIIVGKIARSDFPTAW